MIGEAIYAAHCSTNRRNPLQWSFILVIVVRVGKGIGEKRIVQGCAVYSSRRHLLNTHAVVFNVLLFVRRRMRERISFFNLWNRQKENQTMDHLVGKHVAMFLRTWIQGNQAKEFRIIRHVGVVARLRMRIRTALERGHARPVALVIHRRVAATASV